MLEHAAGDSVLFKELEILIVVDELNVTFEDKNAAAEIGQLE